MLSRLCVVGVLFTAGLPVQSASQTPPGPLPGSLAARETSRHVIGPDDVLTIQAFNCDEISKNWRVKSSGELSLPMIGTLKAAGLTLEQLESVLVERLAKFLYEPQVSVTLSEVRSHPVTVTGAVERPGSFQTQGSRTLFDMIVMAGGTKDAGEKLTLTRSLEQGRIPAPEEHLSADGKFSVVDVDVKDVLEKRSQAANLLVMANDVVSVSQRQPKLVHIIGEVAKPGSVELVNQSTVSLTKVVASAGGLTRLASPKKTIVRHLASNGPRGETAIIDLNMIMSGKAGDLDLEPGDVVIVPSSQWMTYLTSTSLSAVNAGVYAGLQILARF